MTRDRRAGLRANMEASLARLADVVEGAENRHEKESTEGLGAAAASVAHEEPSHDHPSLSDSRKPPRDRSAEGRSLGGRSALNQDSG